MASLTKWCLEAYFANHVYSAQACARTRPNNLCPRALVNKPTHIYIADMRTGEVSKCTKTSERSVFS